MQSVVVVGSSFAILLVFLVQCTQAQSQQTNLVGYFFSLNGIRNWKKVVPTTPTNGPPYYNIFLTNYSSTVLGDGSVYMKTSQYTTVFGTNYQFAMLSTVLPNLPKIEQSGANCTERQLAITFSYTIPNNFTSNSCAQDVSGMETFYLLGSDESASMAPYGDGVNMAGGASSTFNVNNSEGGGQVLYSPTIRNFFVFPPNFCFSTGNPGCIFIQNMTATRTTFGNYTITSIVSINATSQAAQIIAINGTFNNQQIFTITQQNVQWLPTNAKTWLGHGANGTSTPLVFIGVKCIDAIITKFNIIATDYCAATTATTSPKTSTNSTTTTNPTTTLQPGSSTDATSQMITTDVQSISTTIMSIVTSLTDLVTFTHATGTGISFGTTLNSSITQPPTILSTLAPQSGNSTVSMAFAMSTKSSMSINTILFIVLGIALACLFCTLLFCAFRKTLRRTTLVRRIYLATPGRRILCCCFGSKLEEEIGRGERLLKGL